MIYYTKIEKCWCKRSKNSRNFKLRINKPHNLTFLRKIKNRWIWHMCVQPMSFPCRFPCHQSERFRNSTLMTEVSTGERHWLSLALVMPNDDDFGAPRNGLGIFGHQIPHALSQTRLPTTRLYGRIVKKRFFFTIRFVRTNTPKKILGEPVQKVLWTGSLLLNRSMHK